MVVSTSIQNLTKLHTSAGVQSWGWKLSQLGAGSQAQVTWEGCVITASDIDLEDSEWHQQFQLKFAWQTDWEAPAGTSSDPPALLKIQNDGRYFQDVCCCVGAPTNVIKMGTPG